MSDTNSILSLDTTRLANRKVDDEDVGSVMHLDRTESDTESENGDQTGGESDQESEYEEYDLTNNPLYQVLSAFLEDDDGNNLCDHIQNLTNAVKENSNKLDKLLHQKQKISHVSKDVQKKKSKK